MTWLYLSPSMVDYLLQDDPTGVIEAWEQYVSQTIHSVEWEIDKFIEVIDFISIY